MKGRVAFLLWIVALTVAVTAAALSAVFGNPVGALGFTCAACACAGAALSADRWVLWRDRAKAHDSRVEYGIVWDSAIAWLAMNHGDKVHGPLLRAAEQANPWRHEDVQP